MASKVYEIWAGPGECICFPADAPNRDFLIMSCDEPPVPLTLQETFRETSVERAFRHFYKWRDKWFKRHKHDGEEESETP